MLFASVACMCNPASESPSPGRASACARQVGYSSSAVVRARGYVKDDVGLPRGARQHSGNHKTLSL